MQNSRSLAVTIILAWLAIGCGTTKPARIYLLTPHPSDVESLQQANPSFPMILVGPVRLPEYLNRSQIIRYSTANELKSNEYHRWAEPLENNVARVLTENLRRQLQNDHVLLYPGLNVRHFDYRVSIDVIRFDVDTSNHVVLTANWALFVGHGDEVLRVQRLTIREPVKNRDYGSIVATQSRALGKLSAAMSREINKTIGE